MEETMELTAEAVQQMEEGISLVFSRWWALQMAVDCGWGGPHSRSKAVSLAASVLNFFTQPPREEPLCIEELDNLLYEGLDNLCTVADDDSVEEVADKLMTMHQECLQGKYESIQKLREVKPVRDSYIRKAVNASEEDVDENVGNDSSFSMKPCSSSSLPNHEAVSQEMEEADNGWVPVSSKKKKSKGWKM